MDYKEYIKALKKEKKTEKVDDSSLNVEVERYDTGDYIVVARGRWRDGIVQDVKLFFENKEKRN